MNKLRKYLTPRYGKSKPLMFKRFCRFILAALNFKEEKFFLFEEEDSYCYVGNYKNKITLSIENDKDLDDFVITIKYSDNEEKVIMPHLAYELVKLNLRLIKIEKSL